MDVALQRNWELPERRRRRNPIVPPEPMNQKTRPTRPQAMPTANPARRHADHRTASQSTSRRHVARAKAQHASAKWYYWPAVLLVMTMTIVLLGASIVRYNEISEVNRQIRMASEDIEALQAQHDTLTMKLAPYMETGRIEKMAKQLGMVYPSRLQRGIATRNPSKLMKGDKESVVANTSNPSQSDGEAQQADLARTR